MLKVLHVLYTLLLALCFFPPLCMPPRRNQARIIGLSSPVIAPSG